MSGFDVKVCQVYQVHWYIREGPSGAIFNGR